MKSGGLLARRINGIDARGCAPADAERAVLEHEGYRIRLDVLADLDPEFERAVLDLGRGALRNHLSLARIFDREVGSLHQKTAHHFFQIKLVVRYCVRMMANYAAILVFAKEFEHLR